MESLEASGVCRGEQTGLARTQIYEKPLRFTVLLGKAQQESWPESTAQQ